MSRFLHVERRMFRLGMRTYAYGVTYRWRGTWRVLGRRVGA